MYILCKLENRAETVDTILYFAASDKEILEEVLLSIFDEIYEYETYQNLKDSHPISDESVLQWSIQRMKNFFIIQVPYLY